MNSYTLNPRFLEGPSGQLFCLHYKPCNKDILNPAIIHVPAFAEEMNKSRKMVALQARRFAEKGYSVYVFDLYGTGDSGGELENITWQTWQQDLAFVCDHALAMGEKNLWLWALRGGCLLASDCLRHSNVVGAIFWQPMRDGKQFVLQLNRLARLTKRTQIKSLAEEESLNSLEVSGYAFSYQLLEQLNKISLVEEGGFKAISLILIDVSIMQNNRANDKLNSLREVLLRQCSHVQAMTVLGDPFWSTAEVVLAPNLLAETDELFEKMRIR